MPNPSKPVSSRSPECPATARAATEPRLMPVVGVQAPPIRGEPLGQLLERIGIDKYDLFICGDGSGSVQGKPVGWGAVALSVTDMRRRYFHGACNDGTSNFAELAAYLAPLNWFANEVASKPIRVYDVHILTDSQYVCSAMTRKPPGRKNFALVQAYHGFANLGLKLHWHHLKRD